MDRYFPIAARASGCGEIDKEDGIHRAEACKSDPKYGVKASLI